MDGAAGNGPVLRARNVLPSPSVATGDKDARHLRRDYQNPDRPPPSLDFSAGSDARRFDHLGRRQHCKGKMAVNVNIARDLWGDPTFKDEAMSQREAWIWLIANASWKPRTTRVVDHIVDLQRGQLAASTRFLASAWMWSAPTVRRYLAKLEDQCMIYRDTGEGLTVTICNYNIYQNAPRGSDAETTQPPAQQRRKPRRRVKEGKKIPMLPHWTLSRSV